MGRFMSRVGVRQSNWRARAMGLAALGLAGCPSMPVVTTTDMAVDKCQLDMARATPTAPTLTLVDSKTMVKKAPNLACLGNFKDAPAPSTMITVNGRLIDFQDSNPVQGADILYYLTADDVLNNKPLTSLKMQQGANATGTDADGKYTMTLTLPSVDTTRLIIGNKGGKAITGSGNKVDTLATYEFSRRFDEAGPTAVKLSTKQAIPGLVSVVQKDGYGVLAGAARDCDNAQMEGAIVTVTATTNPPPLPGDSADCWTGKNYSSFDQDLLFYFTDVGGSTLPTRMQKYTAGNGTFAALNVPPGKGHVTVNGTVSMGGMSQLLGTGEIPVIADAVTIVDIYPTGK